MVLTRTHNLCFEQKVRKMMYTHVNLSTISSPEPKAQGELIVYQSSRRLSVCLSVCLWTFSNLNISSTSGPIVTKF